MSDKHLPVVHSIQGEKLDVTRLREVAGEHITANIPLAEPGEKVATIIDRLRTHDYDFIEYVYVVDKSHRLVGAISMVQLLRMDPLKSVEDAILVVPVTVKADIDQEKAAGIALQHSSSTITVLGENESFLGVLAPVSMLKILRREHIEDLHRLAGISREESLALQAFEAPPIRRVRDRLPWLLVGFIGSMVATLLSSYYEELLTKHLAVAFFIPAIVYLADAIGTQTEAITVRALSLTHLKIKEVIFQELRTGLLIGIALAVVGFPLIVAYFHDLRLALAVGISIFFAGTMASLIGLIFPWILHNAGQDPAFGSGPVATVIQDILSLLVYFTVAWLLLT